MVAVIAAIVAVASHPLTNLLLGERYISAAEIVPAFCISAVLLSAQATLMWLLFTVGRPGAFALLNALVLASKLTAAFVLIPLAGANGAAWSLAISYGMGAIFIALFVAVTPRGAWESSTTDSGDGMQVTGEMSV
jgi:O-antigen/teichoic acid export membrane protein